jgi:hypothetical protein
VSTGTLVCPPVLLHGSTNLDMMVTVKEEMNLEKRTIASLTQDERNEIVQLYVSGSKLKEIVEAYNLKHHTIVCDLVKKAGVPRRNPQKHPRRNGHAAALTPEQELEALDVRRAELKAKIAERAIKFESAFDSVLCRSARQDGTDLTGVVIIHGLTDQFVKSSGMI